MKMRIKPVIEVARVRHISQHYTTWCAGCKKEVELVKIEEAAELAGITIDAVITRAAGGQIHLGLRPEALLFCVNSLLRKNSESKTVPNHWN